MAIPKRAVVRAARSLGATTRAIDLDLLGDEPLGLRGGQYIIVDSGLVLPSGKAVKRAYSPINDDREQNRVELWVMRIDEGPGSGFLHAVAPGSEVAFSGPWGKLYPALASGDAGAIPQRTLIVATDTGITPRSAWCAAGAWRRCSARRRWSGCARGRTISSTSGRSPRGSKRASGACTSASCRPSDTPNASRSRAVSSPIWATPRPSRRASSAAMG